MRSISRFVFYEKILLTLFDVAACKLLEEGVAAIFGPSSPSTYGIVASIAARFDVPHIDYFWRQNEELHADQEPKNPKPMTINFFPDSEMVGKVSQLLQKFLKNCRETDFTSYLQTLDRYSTIDLRERR